MFDRLFDREGRKAEDRKKHPKNFDELSKDILDTLKASTDYASEVALTLKRCYESYKSIEKRLTAIEKVQDEHSAKLDKLQEADRVMLELFKQYADPVIAMGKHFEKSTKK